MKRTLLAVATAAALLLGSAATALADGGAHNCAGTVVSSSAGPGFGQAVSLAAHLQLIDNFGTANCGETPRQNP